MENVHVYLEVGQKKVIAGALDWPGWQRGGRDETSALQALLNYGGRYRDLLPASLEFQPPAAINQLILMERLEGDATTDFGAPAIPPSRDNQPVDSSDLAFFETILTAIWQALDRVVEAATGENLRKGPRGGGRELDEIIEHVLEADKAYLSRLGWQYKQDKTADLPQALAGCRAAIMEGLNAAAAGQIAPTGPRGGKRWPVGYYVRRTAWHTVDHIWEIEDRIE